MYLKDCTPEEIGFIRWMRSLDHRMKEAIYYLMLTGDNTLIINRFRLNAA